jgi:YD repeat-containing protein
VKWNHRVLRTITVLGTVHEVGYSIHEVYYDDDGKPTSWTESVGPTGSSLKDLIEDHIRIGRALTQPILENVDGRLVEWEDPSGG